MTNRNDEIPVRRREGGVPWWVWLIALALVALLAWWLLTMNQGSGTPATTPRPSPSIETPSGSPTEMTSPDASGSPASTWVGSDRLTANLPARAGS